MCKKLIGSPKSNLCSLSRESTAEHKQKVFRQQTLLSMKGASFSYTSFLIKNEFQEFHFKQHNTISSVRRAKQRKGLNKSIFFPDIL